MSWNYRLVRRKFPNRTITAIHEAYYNDHGHVHMISTEPQAVSTKYGLSAAAEDYEMMAEAFKAPVLVYEEIGKNKCKRCIAERKEMQRQIKASLKLPAMRDGRAPRS